METNQQKESVLSSHKSETLLFVADFMNGSQDVFDVACEIADRYDAHLQLLNVIDPEHAPSSPDGQMGCQYRFEMLANKVRAMNRGVVSLLSFGSPECVIPRRAAEVNATVIVIPLNGTANDRHQKRLVRQLARKCDCPVLAISPLACKGEESTAYSVEKLFASIRKIIKGKDLLLRKRIRSAEHLKLPSSFTMTPKSA